MFAHAPGRTVVLKSLRILQPVALVGNNSPGYLLKECACVRDAVCLSDSLDITLSTCGLAESI